MLSLLIKDPWYSVLVNMITASYGISLIKWEEMGNEVKCAPEYDRIQVRWNDIWIIEVWLSSIHQISSLQDIRGYVLFASVWETWRPMCHRSRIGRCWKLFQNHMKKWSSGVGNRMHGYFWPAYRSLPPMKPFFLLHGPPPFHSTILRQRCDQCKQEQLGEMVAGRSKMHSDPIWGFEMRNCVGVGEESTFFF